MKKETDNNSPVLLTEYETWIFEYLKWFYKYANLKREDWIPLGQISSAYQWLILGKDTKNDKKAKTACVRLEKAGLIEKKPGYYNFYRLK